MKMKTILALSLLTTTLFGSHVSAQSTNDISYPPLSSAGHDFNHSPVGQSFQATATTVTAGIYLASEDAFTAWLNTIYPGQFPPGSYPYTVAPTVGVTISLFEGEGTSGNLLHSSSRTLSAPFSGYLDVDYAAAGVSLQVGNVYTILLTDNGPASPYPQGVSGWVVPAVHDFTNIIGNTAAGAYPNGHPMLQGTLYLNDAGIGDNSFHVLDTAASQTTCSGTQAVVTSVGRNFIVVNGGLNAADHVFYTPTPAGTTFLGGTTTFVLGELVSYTGTLDGIGACHAVTMTVEPAAQQATPTPTPIQTPTPPPPTPTPTPVVTPTPTPQYSCTRPTGAPKTEGKGVISLVNASYFIASGKRVDIAPCTKISSEYSASLSVAQRAEWKGYLLNGVTVATSVQAE